MAQSVSENPMSRVQSPLALARADQQAAREAEVRMLVHVVEHARAHPPIDKADRARVKVRESVDGRVDTEPLNGDGVPEVSAAAIADLGATLGLTPVAGRMLVGEAMELAYRLPALWEQARRGEVPAWQARRVAKATITLAREAARFVDRHLHGLTGSIGVAALDRLVDEAILRHDQVRMRERVAATSERRCLEVQLDRCDLLGQVPVHGLLDLPDALALEAALAHGAAQLAADGVTDNRAARRARTVGDLARTHLRLHAQPAPTGRAVYDDETRTLTPVAPEPGALRPGIADSGSLRVAARRDVMLHVHVTDRELIAALRGRGRGAPLLGRAEHARTGDLPITVATVRAWCGAASTRISVLPVLDVAETIHHDGYEIPERLREQVINRDHTCVYPGCTSPARGADIDHVVPYDHVDPARGGATASGNLAALCRWHHLLKTTGRIRYRMTVPGTVEWQLEDGETVVRDHRGTRRAATRPEARSGAPPDP